jgi:AcrR family transcriptional regulator
MSTSEPVAGTAERILDGALAALARHGPRKLSMSDVVHYAGVSRGTLYRYFSNKDELLGAIGLHVKRRSERRLADAIAEQPEPADRLRVVLGVMTRYRLLEPEAEQILSVEADFALSFLQDVFEEWVDFIADALEPVGDHVPAVRDGRLSIRQLAELTLRLGLSAYLTPSEHAEDLAEWILALAAVQAPPSVHQPIG